MPKNQTIWSRNYNQKAYDRLELVVKKGHKDVLKIYAQFRGMSLNSYINYVIQKDMEENPMPIDLENASTSDESNEEEAT